MRKSTFQTGALLNGQVGLDINLPTSEEDGPWSFPDDLDNDRDRFVEIGVGVLYNTSKLCQFQMFVIH